MDDKKYYVVQDGKLACPHIKDLFSPCLETKDFIISKDGERYNFVGFIYYNNDVLISFPKHSFSTNRLIELANDQLELHKQMKILFKCIRKAAYLKTFTKVSSTI